MTVIIQKDGVFYSDSRRSLHGDVVSDTVVKLTKLSPNAKGEWNGMPILALAGAGKSIDISMLISLLTSKGEEGYNSLTMVAATGALKPLDCIVGILTATEYHVIDLRRYDGTKVRLFKAKSYKRSDCSIMGSGATAAKLGLEWFGTDCIGQVCGAIALAGGTCGGFVLSLDTNVNNAKVVSQHYRYPKMRMLLGGVLNKYNDFNLWLGRFYARP